MGNQLQVVNRLSQTIHCRPNYYILFSYVCCHNCKSLTRLLAVLCQIKSGTDRIAFYCLNNTFQSYTEKIPKSISYFFRFGYSPLHIAALNEYSYCANLLLAYGADITARTNGGTSALSMIVRKIPNVLPKFEDMLDQAITLAEHDINDVDCELKLDFRVLVPNQVLFSL